MAYHSSKDQSIYFKSEGYMKPPGHYYQVRTWHFLKDETVCYGQPHLVNRNDVSNA